MKLLIRIVLLGIIVVLGFTVVFPEWFDFRDQVVAEHRAEQAASQERERMNAAHQRHEDRVAELKAHESQAVEFSRGVWDAVTAGDYAALFRHGTESFSTQGTPENIERLQAIYTVVGRELTADEAAQMPGYRPDREEREYLDTGMGDLVSENRYWGENAQCLQTLHLKADAGRLVVDWALIEVFLYPGKEGKVPDNVRGPHVFRGEKWGR
jgi:hypothetical protein